MPGKHKKLSAKQMKIAKMAPPYNKITVVMFNINTLLLLLAVVGVELLCVKNLNSLLML